MRDREREREKGRDEIVKRSTTTDGPCFHLSIAALLIYLYDIRARFELSARTRGASVEQTRKARDTSISTHQRISAGMKADVVVVVGREQAGRVQFADANGTGRPAAGI